MADWDQSDLFTLAPSMYPPEFMWAGEDNTYHLEEEKAVIRKHYNRTVRVLDDGKGYDTLIGMEERLDARHSEAKKTTAQYESRRNYTRVQYALVKEKVVSIAQEREETGDEEAVVERAEQILDEPMGTHWKTDDGAVEMSTAPTESVWFVMACGYNPDERWTDEIPLSDVSIHLRPENGDWGTEFDEDHLHPTDKRLFDGDKTWRSSLESIQKSGERLEEQYDRARRTRELLRFRAAVVKTVLYRFEAYGSVDEMTDEEAGEIARDQKSGDPPITGYRGAEYATEAKEVLDKNPITSFSGLEREMEAPTVSGSSKVDTVKRNIGYNDLPKEKKGFPRFRKMLFEKVEQLEG